MKALILNDYIGKPYAQWVKIQKKTIETRMKTFKYRGDLVICCGSQSMSLNAGRALCVVNLWHASPMKPDDEKDACIEYIPGRISHFLKDWRYFSYDFLFAPCRTAGAFQSIFDIEIPKKIQIIK